MSACFFLILIVLLTSLPTIVTNQVFGLNGADMANPLTLSQSMTRLSGVVADALEEAHQAALDRVNDLIAEGGYDQELSKKHWTTRRGFLLRRGYVCAPTPFPWSSWVPARRIW